MHYKMDDFIDCPVVHQHTHPGDRQCRQIDGQDILWNRGLSEHQEIHPYCCSNGWHLSRCGNFLLRTSGLFLKDEAFATKFIFPIIIVWRIFFFCQLNGYFNNLEHRVMLKIEVSYSAEFCRFKVNTNGLVGSLVCFSAVW